MGLFDGILKGAQDAVNKAVTASKNETVKFTFQALPESLAQLQALPEADLSTPFKAAALTVCAFCAYAASPAIGREMVNWLKGPENLSVRDEQFIRDRFMDGKKVPFSYFEGAVPENNYVPSEPYTISVSSNPYSYQNEGYATLLIRSGGADSPRQVTLRRKGDKWYLWTYEGLLPGIRKAKEDDPWA